MFIDYSTKLFGIIGKNIPYTLSPAIHNYSFEKMGINAVYLAFDIKEEEKFKEIAKGLLEVSEGLNVTIPYKEKIIPLLDGLSKEAEEIGAVNTIFKKRGFNTDYLAVKSLVLEKGIGKVEKSLIFGAGGAAKAAAFALSSLGSEIFIINRTVNKAQELSERLKEKGYSAKVVPSCGFDYDVVVNSTPTPSYIHEECVKGKLAIEFVYSPLYTEFLKRASSKGLKTINGLEILVRQALEAQKIWLGKSLNDKEVVDFLYARKLIR
ncbi:shikimate dehydrogenase [Acidianus sp. HS-5]|uniref:shikimate dehydrogenase family protein n=1 Tax=Acidianus sp. HS-5 TaxID=2886040 RepID=UPI001F193C53|nr:shikimate dehydrogenase [Acidianus sp. HS-5]BDC19724.1 shikimate 5-dehydrogenase [Acidianus sp. HS-5]